MGFALPAGYADLQAKPHPQNSSNFHHERGRYPERLFAAADRVDPEAVITVLQERANERPATALTQKQDDDEIAAMSRTVQQHSAAPSRAGVSGGGSGGDTQD